MEGQPVSIIGGGPAGLMAAEVIAKAGLSVDLFEANPAPGRKFLVAGVGGLNLTHSETKEAFLSRFGTRRQVLGPILAAFGPREIRAWAGDLGAETFVGSSGRIFPKGMQAAGLLQAWLASLRRLGVRFHTRHRWQGWDEQGDLLFVTHRGEKHLPSRTVVLALGGASWPITGSDGGWVPALQEKGVEIAPLKPANCGFEVSWSRHFRDRFSGQPVKSVGLSYVSAVGDQFGREGEFVVTDYGLEGSLVYAVSAWVRDDIADLGQAVIHLDLVPGRSIEELEIRLDGGKKGDSLANRLRKAAGLRGVKAGLLREFSPGEVLADSRMLAARLKKLPVTLTAARPIEEAISTAGGVRFESLDGNLMLKAVPGVFCAGEMLDWEAPTGGYLLTGCMATGSWAGRGVINYVDSLS